MDNSIDFKDLWARQTTSQPNAVELFLEINRFKSKNLRKLVVTNLLLITTSIFISFIWAYYHPRLLTTKIGIIITILAMVIYLFSYNQSFSLLKKARSTASNSEYLKDLLTMKTNQLFLQTTMLNLYFVLLSSGIGLYMYEYASLMTIFWGIFAYGMTIIWILFNWFYLRPKQIKKQQTKLDGMINKLIQLDKQLQG